MRRINGIIWLVAGAFIAAPVVAQPVTKPVVQKGGRVKTNAPEAGAGAGKRVYDKWCAACHDDGPRYPGTASLAAKYGTDLPAALEKRTDLTPEIVSTFVRQGILVMPSFRKTEITDAELNALGAYLSKKKTK